MESMHNLVYLIGRISNKGKVEELEGERKTSKISLAVQRNHKNEDGVYDTDFIDIILYNGIAENIDKYCQKGDLVGVKGSIQTEIVDDKKEYYIIADRVSFLSSTTQHTKEEEYEEE